MKHYSTDNCTICFKPGGSYYGGHVHKDGDKITARFCSSECLQMKHTIAGGCKGCYGEWKPEHGLKEDYMVFGYIDSAGFHKLDEENV